jgi:3-phosphoshikimate 1-carboxyvinyltransferase
MARSVARIPGSKSITARALFTAAGAAGRSVLRRPLVSADTEAFAGGIAGLGFAVGIADDAWTIDGSPGGPPSARATIYCGDSGTTSRFLPALAAVGHGTYTLDASAQMRARPMSPLLGALRALGTWVEAADGDRLPVVITGGGARGGEVTLDAGVSSQFLTALLLMGPLTKNGLTIHVTDLVSAPYIDLTLGVMREFGAVAEREGSTFRVAGGAYQPRDYLVEPDASAASYAFAAAAVTGNTVTVPGLGTRSAQGDLRFATEVLAAMGCRVEADEPATTVTGPAVLRGLPEVNMRDISDTMMTLAAIAPFADRPTRIVDIANTRVKESDRIEAMRRNLVACGVVATAGPDWLEIQPGQPRPALLESFDDHRIAMSFGVTALRADGIAVTNPSCVGKTFPGFYAELARIAADWTN